MDSDYILQEPFRFRSNEICPKPVIYGMLLDEAMHGASIGGEIRGLLVSAPKQREQIVGEFAGHLVDVHPERQIERVVRISPQPLTLRRKDRVVELPDDGVLVRRRTGRVVERGGGGGGAAREEALQRDQERGVGVRGGRRGGRRIAEGSGERGGEEEVEEEEEEEEQREEDRRGPEPAVVEERRREMFARHGQSDLNNATRRDEARSSSSSPLTQRKRERESETGEQSVAFSRSSDSIARKGELPRWAFQFVGRAQRDSFCSELRRR